MLNDFGDNIVGEYIVRYFKLLPDEELDNLTQLVVNYGDILDKSLDLPEYKKNAKLVSSLNSASNFLEQLVEEDKCRNSVRNCRF